MKIEIHTNDTIGKISFNQKCIVGMLGLGAVAIFVIAVFIVKPPEKEPGYFNFSLFTIFASLLFLGVCWFRTIEKSLFSFGIKISLAYFLCQLLLGPLILSMNNEYSESSGWIERDWTVFLSVHLLVLIGFLITYIAVRLLQRNNVII